MSELPDGIPRARPVEPRDSALAVVARRAGGRWELLLGRRSRRSAFMPGHLAFPGGGVDGVDLPGRPGEMERCASRELDEETGIVIPPESWIEAGVRITPPIFSIRFRTAFFVAAAPDGLRLPDPPPSPGEMEELAFRSAPDVLKAWERDEVLVPPPVLLLLRAMDGVAAESVEEVAATLRAVNNREEALPRVEFVRDVWMLPVATRTLPPATHTNVWIPGGRAFAVIDPGCDDDGEVERLLAMVRRRREETGAAPACVVLTHHHEDHVAGAGRVAGELRLPVRAHPETFARMGMRDGRLEELRDGEQIDLGGLTLQALHTPGHAQGHLALHVPERRALVAGDLISGLSTILIDPDEGDMGAYLESLDRVRGLGCRVLLPSHGPPLPPAALDRLVRHRLDRERRVKDALAAGHADLSAIAREAYVDVPEMPAILTERQALAHLLLLERRGVARPRDSGQRRWTLAG